MQQGGMVVSVRGSLQFVVVSSSEGLASVMLRPDKTELFPRLLQSDRLSSAP